MTLTIILAAVALGLCVTMRFARVTYSPLITSASGSVGDTVFSKWKGRAYIRARVTPANPQTSAQTAVRDSMARCVDLWQTFEQQIKTAWNLYAGPFSISGYNAFVKLNRAEEQIEAELQSSPINPDVLAVTDLVCTGGGASGEIDLDWTDPGQGAGYYAYVLQREVGEDAFTVADHDATLMSAETLTITGLTPDNAYYFYLSSELIADNLFSKSDGHYADATT